MKTNLFIKLLILTAAVIGVFVIIFYFYQKKTELSSDHLKFEEDYNQILTESNFIKKRIAFFNFNGIFTRETDYQVLFAIGDNAVNLQDPEGIEALVKTLDALSSNNPNEKKRIDDFKIKASEFLATRVRKNRFKADNTAEQIKTLNAELQKNPNDQEKLRQKNLLIKTLNLLLDQYPSDAERAIKLDSNNAKAYYDLARFFQDRALGDDKKSAIVNFEKVIIILEGKFEKDADYLRANLNLACLYFDFGNMEKAKCYASKTMEKYRAKSPDDYDYLFGVDEEGNLNEPEFLERLTKINPGKEISYADCKNR